MKEEILVECSHIEKFYGKKQALKGVDLKLFANKITFLMGENGAGKSTLCKILALLSKESNGKILYKRREIKGNLRDEYKKVLGYLSHQTFIYNHLTALENLNFFANLYGITNKKEKIEQVMSSFGLTEYKNQIAGTFSRGLQQRLSLARTLLNDPTVLLLDEPFAGLDPSALYNLAQILSELKTRERTILVVTHEIDDTVEIADNFIILKQGRKVFEDTFYSKENLKNTYFEFFGGVKQ
ncbi:MAG: ABC transporter ATP-binding protein [Thermoanaerobaculaceae bacterium]|nr:ABC transporter ATP-binding protein [Thermoanaerobaculaceae bacterium]